jgi:hypothetical protein
LLIVKLDALELSAAFGALLASRLLDENPSNCLGRGGEEEAAAVPLLNLFGIHKPEIRLVYQCRRLKRLAGFLMVHLLGRQPPQLIVDERQKLLGRLGIALLDGRQDEIPKSERV